MGRQIERKTIDLSTDHYYLVNFANGPVLAKGVYFIRYYDGKNKKTVRVIKQ